MHLTNDILWTIVGLTAVGIFCGGVALIRYLQYRRSRRDVEVKPRNQFVLEHDDALRIKELHDKLRVNVTRADKYRVWKAIGELVPETLESDGWQICHTALTVIIKPWDGD